MHLLSFLFLSMLVETTLPFPFDFDMFTSDLDFNSILSDASQPDLPANNDYSFTLPDSSSETYTDFNNPNNQIPLDGTLSDISTGNENQMPTDAPVTFSDSFNSAQDSPDMNLALLDPELQPLIHSPDCVTGKAIYCCDPTKEFFPSGVQSCIYCMNATDSSLLPPKPQGVILHECPHPLSPKADTANPTHSSHRIIESNIPPPFRS